MIILLLFLSTCQSEIIYTCSTGYKSIENCINYAEINTQILDETLTTPCYKMKDIYFNYKQVKKEFIVQFFKDEECKNLVAQEKLFQTTKIENSIATYEYTSVNKKDKLLIHVIGNKCWNKNKHFISNLGYTVHSYSDEECKSLSTLETIIEDGFEENDMKFHVKPITINKYRILNENNILSNEIFVQNKLFILPDDGYVVEIFNEYEAIYFVCDEGICKETKQKIQPYVEKNEL